MNVKNLLGAIAVFGAVALSSLPASAREAVRDAVLRANFADSTINVRSIPDTNAPVRGYGIPDDRVQVLDERIGNNQNLWYRVQFPSGTNGWVDSTYVRLLARGGGGPRDMTFVDQAPRYLVDSYEVKVFFAGGQTRLNVFNRETSRTVLRGEPVSVSRRSDGVSYTGRNVEFFIHNNGKRTLTFF